MTSRIKSPFAAYGVAFLCVVLAIAGRWALEPVIGNRAPFMLFILGAIYAAVRGGFGPGLFAAVSGHFLAQFLFGTPRYTWLPATSQDWAYMALYDVVVLAGLGLVQMLHRANAIAKANHERARRQEEQLRTIVREMSAAQERVRELASIVESAEDAIVTTDVRGRVVTWNAGAERQFGYKASEIIGQPFTVLVPEKMGLYEEIMSKLLAGETTMPIETLAATKTSQLVDVSIRTSALKDENGKVVGASAIIRDICATKRAEAEISRLNHDLKHHLDQTRQLMDLLPVGVAIASDSSCENVEINPAMAAMLGLGPDDLATVQAGWPSAFLLKEPDRVLKYLPLKTAAAENREITGYEARIPNPEGGIDVLGQAVPLRDDTGAVRGAVAAFVDITALKNAAAALKETERRFRAMADSAPLMIWMTHSDQHGIWVNKTWRTFTGRLLELETPEGWAEPVHPEDRLSWNQCMEAAMRTRETFEVELRMLRADGEVRWVLERGVPRFGDKGEFLGFIGSCMDVTEWKQTEVALEKKFAELRTAQHTLQAQNRELALSREELENERARYRELFDSAPIGYVITNREGVIQQVNQAAAEMLNDSPGFLDGFPFARVLAKSERASFFANIGRLTRREVSQISGWEVTVEPHGRSAFPCSVTVNLLQDHEGRVTGLRWILRDITERRETEQRVLRLNSELEERVRDRTAALEAANRELESFSYSVSHDLRAPLRSINGFAKALLEDYSDKLDPQGLEYLGLVYKSSIRMGTLIEDLLELSRVTRGHIHRQEIDVTSLATSVIADLRSAFPDREVHATVQPGLVACADLGLLRIVMENLLGNAWKFTGGKERAEVEVAGRTEDGRTVISVRDNGAGFEMANASRLFCVFQRLHRQEEFAGTGIGLATVKRIISRHDGRVWAEGQVGAGATFYFSLPAIGLEAAPMRETVARTPGSLPAGGPVRPADSTRAPTPAKRRQSKQAVQQGAPSESLANSQGH